MQVKSRDEEQGALQRRTLKITSPLITDVLPVPQACFGYTSPEVARKLGIVRLETAGISTCVGMVLIDKKAELAILAHIDSRTKEERQLSSLLSVRRDMFSRAIIAYTPKVFEKTLSLARRFAEEHSDVVDEAPTSSIGVDIKGEIYIPVKHDTRQNDLYLLANYYHNASFKI